MMFVVAPRRFSAFARRGVVVVLFSVAALMGGTTTTSVAVVAWALVTTSPPLRRPVQFYYHSSTTSNTRCSTTRRFAKLNNNNDDEEVYFLPSSAEPQDTTTDDSTTTKTTTTTTTASSSSSLIDQQLQRPWVNWRQESILFDRHPATRQDNPALTLWNQLEQVLPAIVTGKRQLVGRQIINPWAQLYNLVLVRMPTIVATLLYTWNVIHGHPLIVDVGSGPVIVPPPVVYAVAAVILR